MTDSPAPSSRAAIPPRKPDEHRPAATPGSVPSDRRGSLHDQQRELVRASLIARSPGEEDTTHHRGA
jgi:hypothetical protein